MMNKFKPAIYGFLFGILLPILGVLIGLQVSATVGNLMILPMLFLSELTGVVFGNSSGAVRVLFFLFSGAWWAVVFFAVSWWRR